MDPAFSSLEPLSVDPELANAVAYYDAPMPDSVPSPPRAVSPYVAGPEMDVVEILVHPPDYVRKRTPKEARTFGCVIHVLVPDVVSVQAVLFYLGFDDEVDQNILTGDKVRPVEADGTVSFARLEMNETSNQHDQRDFVLRFYLECRDGSTVLSNVSTTSFYSFSNRKVVERRKNLELRMLNKNTGLARGGEVMFVTGKPFIDSASLVAIFVLQSGQRVLVQNTYVFSETVLEFELPPLPEWDTLPIGAEVYGEFVVSNDGKNFSNAMPFTYINLVDNFPPPIFNSSLQESSGMRGGGRPDLSSSPSPSSSSSSSTCSASVFFL